MSYVLLDMCGPDLPPFASRVGFRILGTFETPKQAQTHTERYYTNHAATIVIFPTHVMLPIQNEMRDILQDDTLRAKIADDMMARYLKAEQGGADAFDKRLVDWEKTKESIRLHPDPVPQEIIDALATVNIEGIFQQELEESKQEEQELEENKQEEPEIDTTTNHAITDSVNESEPDSDSDTDPDMPALTNLTYESNNTDQNGYPEINNCDDIEIDECLPLLDQEQYVPVTSGLEVTKVSWGDVVPPVSAMATLHGQMVALMCSVVHGDELGVAFISTHVSVGEAETYRDTGLPVAYNAVGNHVVGMYELLYPADAVNVSYDDQMKKIKQSL
jgi:hypothetical protein